MKLTPITFRNHPNDPLLFESDVLNNDYIVYLPKTISKEITHKLVVALHGSIDPNTDYNTIIDTALDYFDRFTLIASRNGYPLIFLMPILMRSGADLYPPVDSQILSAATIVGKHWKKGETDFRPDIDLLKAIEVLKMYLSEQDVQVDITFSLAGISAGANFANRFSLLHPDNIDKVVLFAAGNFMYPENQLGLVKLPYPWGIDNVAEIPGATYSWEKFIKLKQFVYCGKDDLLDNCGPLMYECGEHNSSLLRALKSVMGVNSYDQTLKYCEYLKQRGSEVTLCTIDGIAHSVSSEIFKRGIDFILS